MCIQNDTNDVNLSLSCSGESSANTPISSCPLTPASNDLTSSPESSRLISQLCSLQMDTIDEENETDGDENGGSETGVRLVSEEGKIISPSPAKKEPSEDTGDQPKSSTTTPGRLVPKPAVLLVGQGSSRTSPSSRVRRGRSSQQSGTRDRSGSKMTTSKNTCRTTTSTPSCSCSCMFICYMHTCPLVHTFTCKCIQEVSNMPYLNP